ncbi:MAG: class I SAM-dependent methyltransferase [Deltaproteobacteria bacterium]|nr:class I SAM-dependent methyltransferase [Deltaproteobacteria bacterium]
MSHRFALPVLALAIACGGSEPPPETNGAGAESTEVEALHLPSGDLDAVLAGPHRSDDERARDPFRHPKETLAFFGLTPTSTVVEIWPGGGWYTKVLAPYLRDGGQMIVANVSSEGEGFLPEMVRNLNAMMDAQPSLYDQVQRAELHAEDLMTGVPDDSVDLVLLPRTFHNWVRRDHDIAAYLGAIVRVLKPGGVLGVVQHRAPADHPEAETGEAGYLSEAFIIRLAEEAGLRLDDRSEINANPNDDHDHPEGVWSLPPVLRGSEETADAMRAIGESDRMTLRFVPAEGSTDAE